MSEYSEKLKHPKWQRKRLEIFKRDKWKCKKCQDEETTLCVHHLEYHNNIEPWDYENKFLVTLCEDCHDIVEKIKDIDKTINYDEIKILKLGGWTDGSKLFFISTLDKLVFRIKDKNGKQINSYDIPTYMLNYIVDFISKHLKR